MDIRAKIQTLLSSPNYHPLRRAEIASKLRLNAAERRDYRRVLEDMLQHGEIARVRQDRFVLPQEADLVIGRISFNEKGFAFVIPDLPAVAAVANGGRADQTRLQTEGDIYVAEEDTWVAMHGDKVVVRLNREPKRFRTVEKRSGRVIRILERAHETVVGTLQKTKYFHYIVPDEPRIIHDIYTKPTRNAQVGDKVVVKLAEWKSRHVNPEGEIVEVLGKSTAPGVDILAIIRQHHLPTQFSEQVLRETGQMPEATTASELSQRLDLREKFIVTIDPDDAKDFDDAVNVDELYEGAACPENFRGWRLGVHIADVSHYVQDGSALDREARARGNSVYLVDRVLPMLPEKLSNNLCSLRPRVDRLTQSCFIEFTPKLTVRKVDFALSVICSQHRLTYKEAFALLAGQASRPSNEAAPATRLSAELLPSIETVALQNELKKMWRLASRLRQQRFAQGSLDLNFPEVKVRLDKNGKPIRIEKVYYDISHQLIEEFMLAANEAVARYICNLQIPCLYRIHEDPDLEKLRDFRVYAQSFGYKVGDVTNRRELQKLLAAAHDKPEEYAIHLALLRSLKRARYSPNPVGHYGLAKKFYTHFTSPIRRYADLVVHRTLAALVSAMPAAGRVPSRGEIQRRHPPDGGSGPTTDRHTYGLSELASISEHVSRTERVADEAEKESVELKKLEYFQQQLMSGQLDLLDAVVSGVKNFGIFVELTESLVQGLVHISTLEDDFYHYDEQRVRLVGKRTKRVIQIGDKLKVQVERVDVFKRQIDFRVVGETP